MFMTKIEGLTYDQYRMLSLTQDLAPTSLKYKQRHVLAKVKKVQKQSKEELESINSIHTLVNKLQKNMVRIHESLEALQNNNKNLLPTLSKVLEVSDQNFSNETEKQLAFEDARSKAISELGKNEKALDTFTELTEELTLEAKEEFNISLDRVKLYAFASERLNKPLEEISDDDISELRPDYERFIADQNSLEFSHQVHEQKSVSLTSHKSSQTLTRAQKKKKKDREKRKAAAVKLKIEQEKVDAPKEKSPVVQVLEITPEQKYLHSLNQPSYPLEFREHPRCVNWRRKKDPKKIKDINGNQIYQNMTLEQLAFVTQQHKLHGADRLLSNEEAVRRHGLSYPWQNDKGETQVGVKFPATMRTPTNIYAGEVQLGFDPETKVIFHARFLPLGMGKKISTVKDFREPLEIPCDDGVESEEETEEKSWENTHENTHPVTFNSGKKGSLIWEIGERAERRTTIELARIRK